MAAKRDDSSGWTLIRRPLIRLPALLSCSAPPPAAPCCPRSLFLRKLKQTLRIPVLALVDSDPYGLKILSVYMKGGCCGWGRLLCFLVLFVHLEGWAARQAAGAMNDCWGGGCRGGRPPVLLCLLAFCLPPCLAPSLCGGLGWTCPMPANPTSPSCCSR
jgi:hypothetical protein